MDTLNIIVSTTRPYLPESTKPTSTKKDQTKSNPINHPSHSMTKRTAKTSGTHRKHRDKGETRGQGRVVVTRYTYTQGVHSKGRDTLSPLCHHFLYIIYVLSHVPSRATTHSFAWHDRPSFNTISQLVIDTETDFFSALFYSGLVLGLIWLCVCAFLLCDFIAISLIRLFGLNQLADCVQMCWNKTIENYRYANDLIWFFDKIRYDSFRKMCYRHVYVLFSIYQISANSKGLFYVVFICFRFNFIHILIRLFVSMHFILYYSFYECWMSAGLL